ncbi:MAG: DUF1080 domain-containing protein [Planctomycetota bacterium]
MTHHRSPRILARLVAIAVLVWTLPLAPAEQPRTNGPADSSEKKETQQPQWQELFNGRDLTGWEANTNPNSFSVEEGVLKVHGKSGMSHLFYVGETGNDVAFKDFELVLLARSEPNSNSGIFFHTDRELRGGKYLNKGYELQLNSSKKEKRKTGSLYGVVDLDESAADESEWFKVRLLVRGSQITVFINDNRVVDYHEPDNPKRSRKRAKRLLGPAGGAIAIQAHDPVSVFYFKSIRIREIPAQSQATR